MMGFLRSVAGFVLIVGVPLVPTIYILLWLGPTTFWQNLATLILIIPLYLIFLVMWLIIMTIIKSV